MTRRRIAVLTVVLLAVVTGIVVLVQKPWASPQMTTESTYPGFPTRGDLADDAAMLAAAARLVHDPGAGVDLVEDPAEVLWAGNDGSDSFTRVTVLLRQGATVFHVTGHASSGDALTLDKVVRTSIRQPGGDGYYSVVDGTPPRSEVALLGVGGGVVLAAQDLPEETRWLVSESDDDPDGGNARVTVRDGRVFVDGAGDASEVVAVLPDRDDLFDLVVPMGQTVVNVRVGDDREAVLDFVGSEGGLSELRELLTASMQEFVPVREVVLAFDLRLLVDNTTSTGVRTVVAAVHHLYSYDERLNPAVTYIHTGDRVPTVHLRPSGGEQTGPLLAAGWYGTREVVAGVVAAGEPGVARMTVYVGDQVIDVDGRAAFLGRDVLGVHGPEELPPLQVIGFRSDGTVVPQV